MGTVKSYLSLVKFSHTIFAMPFALVGFFIGLTIPFATTSIYPDTLKTKITGGAESFSPDSVIGRFLTGENRDYLIITSLLLVLACMVFARNAAMAFNRYLDRNYDSRNPRTATREIPSGTISASNALLFTIVNCILFITATFFINPLCFYLSPLALAIVLGYSYTKRFTVLCHLILGLGLSLAPIGAYIAVTGRFDLLPLIFSGVVLCWVSGFDIIYALQDVEFDRSQNLYSIPSKLGRARGLAVSRGLHLVSAALVVFAGWYGGFGWLFWVGAVIFSGMLIYQQQLVKPNDLSKVNLAFMTANGIASVVFAIFVIADLFIHQ